MACDPPFTGSTCEWPLDTSCLGDEWDNLDDLVQDRSAQLASATLRRLTGYRVGGCPITVRPCKPACCFATNIPYDFYARSSFNPQINTSGLWVNSCGHLSDCSCGPLCEIALPGPVGRVDEVKIDGLVIAPEKYRVDGMRLVWTWESTPCPFPTCQDMSLADTEVGTFSVTYLNGYPVDGAGAYAAAVLAMEFARACSGGKCRLPSGVTQITRQGVSMTIAAGAFPGGVTGVREVDTYIALWNPHSLRQQTGVWSPDLRVPRVVG